MSGSMLPVGHRQKSHKKAAEKPRENGVVPKFHNRHNFGKNVLSFSFCFVKYDVKSFCLDLRHFHKNISNFASPLKSQAKNLNSKVHVDCMICMMTMMMTEFDEDTFKIASLPIQILLRNRLQCRCCGRTLSS